METYQKCINCGAEYGLHRSETNQCPHLGIEETRDGHKQKWDDATFKAELTDVAILKWLQSKKYQTERGEQEYKMYFDVDMPKIIRAAINELG